jgi:hypothetical protein
MTYLSKLIGTNPALRGMKRVVGANAWGDYYYLWSLERVGVIYNIKEINGKDWYDWGSKIIVTNQQADGSWKEAFPGAVDTCFALLFLKRVNVAEDLTTRLKKMETSTLDKTPREKAKNGP